MIFKKDIDIQVDEKIIKKNRIPILIQDKQWKNMMANHRSRMVGSLSKELEKIISEEKSLQQSLSKLKSQKDKRINKILHLSDLINRHGQEHAIIELEDCKKEINLINNEIDNVLQHLEVYKPKIEEINLKLLKETIKIAYRDITSCNAKRISIDLEIIRLREELGKLRDEKDEVEKEMEELYSFLHMMLGAEEMERLDIKYLDK